MSIQITFRSISESAFIEDYIHKYFSKLTKVYQKINHCHVVIDLVQNHKHKGKIFSISIDMTIPKKELVSKKQNENLYRAIRDSFHTIEKLLKKYTKKYPKHIVKVSSPLLSKDTERNTSKSLHLAT